MSAYVLIVQALRNALNAIVTNVDWDELFGDGALDELVALNSIRFNLDGKNPVALQKWASSMNITSGVFKLIHFHAILPILYTLSMRPWWRGI